MGHFVMLSKRLDFPAIHPRENPDVGTSSLALCNCKAIQNSITGTTPLHLNMKTQVASLLPKRAFGSNVCAPHQAPEELTNAGQRSVLQVWELYVLQGAVTVVLAAG